MAMLQIDGAEVAMDSVALRTMLFSLSAGLLVSLLLRGAMGEELGLRGFVLPRLQARTTPIRASLVIGSLWGLWHLPVLFGHDVGTILAYLVFVHAVTMLFTWLFNHTSGSLVPVLLLHATINWEEGIEVVVPSLQGTGWEALTVVTLVLLGVAAATSLRRGAHTPPSRSMPVGHIREPEDPSPAADARTAVSGTRRRS